MSEVVKTATPGSLASNIPPLSMQDTGIVAGEAILAYAAVYIKASDGKMYNATGAAANAAARARGWSADVYATGDKDGTIYYGDITVNYASATMTPGDDLFLSGTVPGGLANVASTGGVGVLGFVLDSSRARLFVPR